MLENDLDVFLAPEDVALEVHGTEFMVFSKSYGDFYTHTHAHVDRDIEAAILAREVRKADYLKQRFMSDWQEGRRVYVHCGCEDEASIRRLLAALNAKTRCVLLWVVEAKSLDERGRVEVLAPNLLRGSIANYGRFDEGPRLDFLGWELVCQTADARLRGLPMTPLASRRLEASFLWSRDTCGVIDVEESRGRCRILQGPGFNVPVACVAVAADFGDIERAVFSTWVYLRKAFDVRNLVLAIRNAEAINVRRPDLSRVEEWQQIWLVMKLDAADEPVEIVVYVEADPGSQFYFEGWQIEAGAVASESLRPAATPMRSWASRASVAAKPRTSSERLKGALAGMLLGSSKISPSEDQNLAGAAADDQTAHALLATADALMHAGLYDAADTVLDAGVSLFPWSAELSTHRAVCAERRGYISDVARRWGEVVRTFPEYALGHHRLAATLRTMGDIPGAQRVVDCALADHAGDAAMVSEAARVLCAAARWSEAVAQWDAAIALDNSHPAWSDERALARDRLAQSK